MMELAEELCARVCDTSRDDIERGVALQELLSRWPEKLASLREDGRLPARGLPTTQEWDAAGTQRPLALLLAASLDPAEVERLLADRARPSAGEFSAAAKEPDDPWAVDVVAEVAPRVSELAGRTWAERYERLIRRRILRLPASPRWKPDSLFYGHAQVLEQVDAAQGMDGSLEVIEARLRLGVWKAGRVGEYLRLWHRRWGSARGLALVLTRRVQDPLDSSISRITARQALQDLHRSNQTHQGQQDLTPFLSAADEALIRVLSDVDGGDQELQAMIVRELDRWLSPERVATLREQGLLAPRGIPHLLELPGAPSDEARLAAALDDHASHVNLDELVSTLELAPELESAEELARLLTAIRLAARVTRRNHWIAVRLVPLLQDLLEDDRKVAFQPHEHAERAAWTLSVEAQQALDAIRP